MSRPIIETATGRAGLPIRREPHWSAPIATGLFVGFRKLEDGGTWIARQRTDDGQKYESLGRLSKTLDYAQACEDARAWSKRLAAGVGQSDVKTVADLCAAYVKDRRQEKGEDNARHTAGVYKNHVLNKPLAKMAVDKVATRHIKEWRAGLTGADRTKDKIFAQLKAALNYGVAERIIAADRALEWKRLKNLGGAGRRELYLNVEQRAALVAAAPEDARRFLRGLCLAPLRPGALARCTVKHLHAHHKGNETLHVEFDKVNGDRHIPLAPVMLDLCNAEAKGKTPAAPLFADGNGAAWNAETWKVAIRKAREAAKLPADTCAYTLRHSVITDMIVGGMDALTVAKIAGTSLKQIEKHYGKLRQDHARAMLAAMAL